MVERQILVRQRTKKLPQCGVAAIQLLRRDNHRIYLFGLNKNDSANVRNSFVKTKSYFYCDGRCAYGTSDRPYHRCTSHVATRNAKFSLNFHFVFADNKKSPIFAVQREVGPLLSGCSVARYRASMGCWRSSVQIRPSRLYVFMVFGPAFSRMRGFFFIGNKKWPSYSF